MKKIKYLLFTLLLVIPTYVLAAGSAAINGPASVENGANVTVSVTIYNTAAWNIRITGSGSTPGCSNVFADVTADGQNTSRTFSVTCKSNSVGSITFTATGDITSSDGVNSPVNLSKTVTITKPRERESESRLNSLSVDGYNIGFDKDKKAYSIVIEPTVTSINIKASAISRYASISGTGTKNIDSDENVYTITCTSETGAKTVYTINVSVKDDNPIKANINGKEYIVYKTNKSLTAPINYTETSIKINDFDIPAYTNETTKLTVVGIKDNDGNIKYAIYNTGTYSLYNENQSNSLLLYITDKEIEGYKKTTIKINENEYNAYELDNRSVLVYAMNIATGEYNYYKYDKEDNIFQYYEITESKKDSKTSNKGLSIITITFIITTILLLGYIIYTKIPKKKRKKNK
jgi:hypothetical protein